MYNFDSYNVLLSIATNIPVLLMTAFVLQGHIFCWLYSTIRAMSSLKNVKICFPVLLKLKMVNIATSALCIVILVDINEND